jgi:hypothetical protein
VKASDELAEELMPRVGAAIANADWLANRAQENNFNPFTEVHNVMRHFLAVAGQQGA